MKSKLIKIFFLLSIIVFYAWVRSDELSDFSTPEKTIGTFYKSYENKDISSQCFYPPGMMGNPVKFWSKYKIINTKNSTMAGKSLPSGIVVSKDAIEIMVELEIDNSQSKKVKKTKFWYLLQKISGEWKIIENSHISDKLYPAYD